VEESGSPSTRDHSDSLKIITKFKTTVVNWVATNGRNLKHINYCLFPAYKSKIITVLRSVLFL
jgi:hypothetical protein